MTEQPPSASREALDLAWRIRNPITGKPFLPAREAALAIDAICEQRVSDETERCARVWFGHEGEGYIQAMLSVAKGIKPCPRCAATWGIAHCKVSDCPAERPAPPQQPRDFTRWRGAFAPMPEDDTWDQDSPRRIGVPQQTQDKPK